MLLDIIDKKPELLRPAYMAKSVAGITPESLPHIQTIAFDVDGTLSDYHTSEIEPRIKDTLLNLGDAGYTLYIISNAYTARVDELNHIYGEFVEEVISPATVTPTGENPKSYRKPRPDMLQYAIRESSSEPQETLMVGDQLLKDVVSANRAGAESLLVPRRGSGDDIRVRVLQRPVEALTRRALGIHDFPETLRRLDVIS